jgi:hypothetical protein
MEKADLASLWEEGRQEAKRRRARTVVPLSEAREIPAPAWPCLRLPPEPALQEGPPVERPVEEEGKPGLKALAPDSVRSWRRRSDLMDAGKARAVSRGLVRMADWTHPEGAGSRQESTGGGGRREGGTGVMVRWFAGLTPAMLVGVFSPLLFFLAPDGIPNAFAGCGVGQGITAINPTVSLCTRCSSNSGGYDDVQVTDCSASNTGVCELSVSLKVTLSSPDGDGCEVHWAALCRQGLSSDQCGQQLAATAPVTNHPISHSQNCDTEGEEVVITLVPVNCNCSTGGANEVFVATATCST